MRQGVRPSRGRLHAGNSSTAMRAQGLPAPTWLRSPLFQCGAPAPFNLSILPLQSLERPSRFRSLCPMPARYASQASLTQPVAYCDPRGPQRMDVREHDRLHAAALLQSKEVVRLCSTVACACACARVCLCFACPGDGSHVSAHSCTATPRHATPRHATPRYRTDTSSSLFCSVLCSEPPDLPVT